MTTWITDSNGNRASVELYGSEAAARAALATNKRCRDCTNCSDCSDCSRVSSVATSLVIGPTRSDGYQFVMSKSGSVHAGCRVMPSLAEAREHWTRTRGGTPLGLETMLILDYLEAAAKPKA